MEEVNAAGHAPGPPQAGFYGWKLLGTFWLILFTNFAFPLYGASVVNAYMAADLHFNRGELGLAYGMFQWMAGLPAPLAALCINKKGVRFTMTLGCMTVMAGAMLMALVVHTSWQLVVVYGVVIGLGALAGGVLGAQSGISRWFIEGKARAITLVHTGSSIGGFVAAPLLNRVIAGFHGNWRAGWWLIAGLSGTGTLLSAFLIKERPSDLGQFPDGGAVAASATAGAGAGSGVRRKVYKTAEEWPLREVLRAPAMWLLLISLLGFSAGYPLFLAHGVVHLRDLGYTPGQAAFSISIMLGASLVGTLVFAALGDRIEPRYLWSAASLVFCAGMLLALRASGAAGLYAYAVCLGSGFGVGFSAMMSLPANYFGARAYPSVVGLMRAVGTTAGAVGASLAGYVFDRTGSYAPAFYCVSGLAFAAAVLLLLTTPPMRGPA